MDGFSFFTYPRPFSCNFFRPRLVSAWQAFAGWPLILQIAAWLLALPLVLGLWIWQMAWAVWLRVILVLGLAWVTVYLFFPRKTAKQLEPLPQE